jgi:hypothetical protein
LEGYYGIGRTVISFTMHKSIYRHMLLWLEIDFIPVYCEGYYGTGIGESDEKGMVLMECASESGGYHGGRADGAD